MRKSKNSPAEVSAPASSLPPAQDRIRARAYELFLARGGEHGHALEDWVRAERELAAQAQQPQEPSVPMSSTARPRETNARR